MGVGVGVVGGGGGGCGWGGGVGLSILSLMSSATRSRHLPADLRTGHRHAARDPVRAARGLWFVTLLIGTVVWTGR